MQGKFDQSWMMTVLQTVELWWIDISVVFWMQYVRLQFRNVATYAASSNYVLFFALQVEFNLNKGCQVCTKYCRQVYWDTFQTGESPPNQTYIMFLY